LLGRCYSTIFQAAFFLDRASRKESVKKIVFFHLIYKSESVDQTTVVWNPSFVCWSIVTMLQVELHFRILFFCNKKKLEEGGKGTKKGTFFSS